MLALGASKLNFIGCKGGDVPLRTEFQETAERYQVVVEGGFAELITSVGAKAVEPKSPFADHFGVNFLYGNVAGKID